MTRALLPTLALLTACSGYDAAMKAGADMGVTQGGMQDIGLARDIIEQGGIPGEDQFSAEGLFSEHDLPLDGAECDEVLCPRAAASRHTPVDGSRTGMLVQLGFGTDIDPETFERRPLALSVAVDVSGSMGDFDKLGAVRDALHVMVDQLGEADAMALVAFDDRARLVEPATVMDAAGLVTMHEAIDRLAVGGSTNIEAGLELAYDHLPHAASGVSERVMLFTDAQPNVGATGAGSFVGMVDSHADEGVGITVFGAGLDLGAELADAISRTRGGNYFYLAGPEEIREVFDSEFDYLVTPVAYDVQIAVEASPGLDIVASYGMAAEGQSERVELSVATLFLSSRSGGMGLVFDGDDELYYGPGGLATFDIELDRADGSGRARQALTVAFRGGTAYEADGVEADDLGVYKMSGLVDEYHGLVGGAALCDGTMSAEQALGRVLGAADRLGEMADALGDADLDGEARLMLKLADNIEVGGRQACW